MEDVDAFYNIYIRLWDLVLEKVIKILIRKEFVIIKNGFVSKKGSGTRVI